MSLQIKQTVQQRLLMAPNVTLALEILRMATMELQVFLRQQADENPLLELEEPESEEQTAESDNNETAAETPDEPYETWNSNEEWSGSSQEKSTQEILEQRLFKSQTLQESLEIQLGCQPLKGDERCVGQFLITHLDQYGYLDTSLEDLSTTQKIDLNILERILWLIQRFDPSGVGARDLRECLMIQLENQDSSATLAYRVLKNHFDLFAQRRLSSLAKITGSTQQEIQAACDSLKCLNPKPGSIFSGDVPPSVTPDLIIHQREKYFDVELNDDQVPHVSINRTYYRMLKNPNTPKDAKEFLSNKFRQASWVVKAIQERNGTLLAIARCLISLQREFLEKGPRAIKPLTQSQVASLVGRHPSTISRAIAGKMIDTPYGIFRLEQLFASQVPQANNKASVSDAEIKSEIRRLIDEEDDKQPLSDETLAKRFANRQISVARRTIAKYRTSLRILPAHLRRQRL